MNESVLLVGVDVDRLFEYKAALADITTSVLVSTTFEDARTVLFRKRPAVLITEVPLHEYNGLHLVLWSRVRLPHVRCIVVGGGEHSLEAEVIAAGARYLGNGNLDALAIAARLAFESENLHRRWGRKALPWGLAAEVDGVPARVREVSYGGGQLETDRPVQSEATSVSLSIPQPHMSLQATLKWTGFLSTRDSHFAGVEIRDSDTLTAIRWRALVDLL